MTRARRAFIASLVLAALLPLAACQKEAAKPQFHGVDITGAEYARDFALPDVDGKTRRLADFKGKVTVVFFGYTQCPDVCPTTMADLAAVKRSLGAQGEQLQGVFITVDPERDTPQVLKPYVANFDPGFVALRGSAEQTAATAKEFKVFYAKEEGREEGGYTISHTAGAYVFDRQGRVRLFTKYDAGAQALADDVKKLLAGA